MEISRDGLTKDMRWHIAEQLANDRLEEINANLKEVLFKETLYTKYGKRLLDLVLASVAFVITLPINTIIGVITLFDVGYPLLFKQIRSGKNGKPFTIIKFRNMRNTYDERGELLPADQRVTKWGKLVRKTSLDELLNFISIIKGDMSIIGPRPLPPEYLIRYNKRHKARLKVKPGLECPPHEVLDHAWSWQEHLDNDIWYVEHISIKTDILMCIRLVQYVFNKKSSEVRSKAGSGTFMGYDLSGKAIRLEQVPQEYIEREYKYREDIERTTE